MSMAGMPRTLCAYFQEKVQEEVSGDCVVLHVCEFIDAIDFTVMT